jgi:hypothetical protein
MSIRFTGLLPAVALLVASAAQAQQATIPNTPGGGGSMAYPQSLPSGQFKVNAPTQPDTGTMAYPSSPGGVTQTQAPGRDTGNMAYPTMGAASSNLAQPSKAPAHMQGKAEEMGMPGAMRPDVAPTPAQTAAARALETAPSSQPVPYTDFLPPATPAHGHMMHGKPMPMHGMAMHHVRTKSTAVPAAAKAASPAPAGSAPTAAGTTTSDKTAGSSSSK